MARRLYGSKGGIIFFCTRLQVKRIIYTFALQKDKELWIPYTEEWAEFVLANRRNLSRKNIHDCDIVIGPIANDKVGVQIRRYILGDITVKQLVEELRFRQGITIQYFFASEQAIKQLNRP